LTMSVGKTEEELLSLLSKAREDREREVTSLSGRLADSEASLKEARSLLQSKEETIRELKVSLQGAYDTIKEERQEININVQNFKEKFERIQRETEERYERKLKAQRETHLNEYYALKAKHVADIQELTKSMRDELSKSEAELQETKNIAETLSQELKIKETDAQEKGEALTELKKKKSVLETEMHTLKLNLVKETNINNRLIDEIKRSGRELDRNIKEKEELHKELQMSQREILEKISSFAALDNLSERVEESFRRVRLDVGDLFKGQLGIMKGVEEIKRFQREGDREMVEIGVQTVIGDAEMEEYAALDHEALRLVMRVKEDLVQTKSEMISLQRQNQLMNSLLRQLEKTKEEEAHTKELEENEGRVRRLEEQVRMIKGEVASATNQRSNMNFVKVLEGMRKDLSELKTLSKSNEPPPFYSVNAIPKTVYLSGRKK